MMCERRALLDPDMYKISEEDSQDEEVLASYTEDALKLGIGGDDITNGNAVLNVGRHSRVSSWNSGGSRYSRHGGHDESLATWEYTGDISTSQFNPSKLRIVHGSSSSSSSSRHHHHQHTARSSSSSNNNSHAVRIIHSNASHHHNDDPDNSVDWPETSTNSDSCLSGGDDPERMSGATAVNRKNHNPASIGFGAMNNNKFIGKTYFGDDLRSRRNHERGDEPVEGSSSGGVYLYNDNHHHRQHQTEHQSRSKNLPKRTRRRNSRNVRESELSTSGSDCSQNHEGEDGESSSSSSSSGSHCDDCASASRDQRGRSHHHHHHRHEHHHRRRRNAGSSSEVEEYDSSYSESSYGDDDEEDEYYDDYYDDEDDADKCFDDIVKFLSDGEVESSTNAEGDLFLVEYSADESDERPTFRGTTSLPSPESHNQQLGVSSQSNVQTRLMDDDGTESVASTPSQDSGRRNSIESGGNKHDSEKPSTSTATPTSSSASGQKYQKSGKGAKGKISRLLKRKGKDPNTSSKSSPEENVPLATTSSVPGNAAVGTAADSPSLQHFPSSSTVTTGTASSTPSPAHPSGSGRKQKGNAAASSVPTSAPEKVFRFKDEHGGETRTVFVDIPQSARTGNLLGRRATLIESILGIIPGHFSSPASLDSRQQLIGNNSDRIMVAGFVPDGIASKYRRIKIGDWLQSVDDIPVDHGNVDQVLNSRSMYGKRRTAFETEYLRLKLTLRRVAGCMVSLPPSSGSPQSDSSPEDPSLRNSATTCITEPCWSMVSPQVQSNVAIIFISSTNGAIDEDASGQDESAAAREKSKDVVFSWPLESESKMVKALVASQGMFSTLYRLLWDVTGSHPIVSKVVIDDCEMDVTYTSDDNGKSLLIVGVASSLSTFNLHHHSHEMQHKSKGEKGSGVNSGTGSAPQPEGKKKEKKIRWREPQAGGVTVSTRVLNRLEAVLKYQFGSFARAFKGNDEKVNRLLANSLAALNDLSEDFLFLQIPGNFLRFPNCIRSGIDDVLYSFETSDALGSYNPNKANRSNGSSTSSRRRSKDTFSTPVYHCHGSCLMYKGFLITSHLENDLASAFHGWWRTQLGLWEGIKRNALLDKWKPVSRLALWQETCISKKGPGAPKVLPASTLPETDVGVAEEENVPKNVSPKLARCFSGLVGIGNFTLGFVLEHLTDAPAATGPDADWLRRAMATLCRLYQSGLSRSFECWLDGRNGGRDEYVELCGTSSSSSTKHVSQQEKLGVSQSSSRGATASLKKTPATGSILKNTESSNVAHLNCPVHSQNPTAHSSPVNACTCSQQSSTSSPLFKGFMLGSSSTSSSSSSSFGGSGIRSGITGGIMMPPSPEEFSSITRHGPGNGDPTAGFDSDEDMENDDTTTGTGSDSSSFKWYERAASEHSGLGSGKGSPSEVKHIRVTRGNVLLDYMQVEFGRGVMLSSKDIHEGWAVAIRHNFRQSVTVIHQILHKAANARLRLEERGNDKKWVSLALAPISEHGILFTCQVTDPRDVHKKKPRKREIGYWVVGRIYPDEREIYVCYEDGPLSQNLVEIAYKIALNVHC